MWGGGTAGDFCKMLFLRVVCAASDTNNRAVLEITMSRRQQRSRTDALIGLFCRPHNQIAMRVLLASSNNGINNNLRTTLLDRWGDINMSLNEVVE